MADLLGGALQLMGNLPALFELMEKSFFITVCFFLGNLSWKGWRNYKNWGLNIIASLLLGLGVLATSVLLYEVIPIKIPFVPYAIQALISAIVFYIILRLFSKGTAEVGKFVKGERFKKLRKDFNELKEDVYKLLKVLERKKIMPEPLSAKALEQKLIEVLADKNIKEFKVIKKRSFKDVKNFEVKTGKKIYEAEIDLYTGELLGFNRISLTAGEKIKKNLKALFNNKKALTGLIITIAFAVLLIPLINSQSIDEIQSSLDLTLSTDSQGSTLLSGYEVQNNTCLLASDALYLIGTDQVTEAETTVPAPIITLLLDDNPGYSVYGSLSMSSNSTDYYLITLTTISEEAFNDALMDYIQTNMFNVIQGNIDFCEMTINGSSISNKFRVCSVKTTGEVCECEQLNNLEEFCFIFSEQISEEISSQLEGLEETLGGLGGLSGMLG